MGKERYRLIRTRTTLEGVLLTPLSIVATSGGDVMHAMKKSNVGYSGFGEAYFSQVESGVIKAWKRHHEMTLNLVVPVGAIHFVLYDDRHHSSTCSEFQQVTLSTENYYRLTVPPMVWVGFQGCDSNISMLLNIANIEHHPYELDQKKIDEIVFDWSKK